MADETNTTQAGAEPSMEEILASIRKIISDEDTPASVAAPEPVAEPEEDIVDLTQMVQEDGTVVDLTTAPEEVSFDEEISLEEPVDEPQPPAEPVAEGPLVSGSAVDAAASAMASLANTVAIERLSSLPQMPMHIGNGSRTLEDMVLELMRPMLKGWLDENLPAIVERLVQKEVERISRRAKD